jgi:hypothetical protein
MEYLLLGATRLLPSISHWSLIILISGLLFWQLHVYVLVRSRPWNKRWRKGLPPRRQRSKRLLHVWKYSGNIFAAAAREKISKVNEVRWLPDASDISTGSLNTLMEDADTIAPKGRNRGSKSHKATKIDRLNAQIKKQERLANTAQVFATSLQATPLGANTPITLECSPMMSDTPGTTPNKTCNRVCCCQI